MTVLDLDQLKHAKSIGIDAVAPGIKTNLVITCIDQLSSKQVTRNRELITIGNDDEFARFVADSIEIGGGLYANTSPYSTTIRQVERA